MMYANLLYKNKNIMTNKHCKFSTIWHFFVLFVIGALITGGIVYMWKMEQINYMEKEIAAQSIQLKNAEITKYKQLLKDNEIEDTVDKKEGDKK